MAESDESWRTWLAEHGRALVLLARQFAPSQADAEDIVQEALVRCWRSQDRVNDPVAFLFACVRRAALDWQRGRRRLAHREQAAARPEAEPRFDCPAEQDERRAAIEAALDSLPAEQAEVLVLKIWGGLSLPQVAAALDVPANTAASRYRYALAKLREQLAEETIP
jgi:RNA polymerase sigma-70 factor (ECF subfamily)